MPEKSLWLTPFSALPSSTTLSLKVTATRQQASLQLSYQLSGDLKAVAIPKLNQSQTRTDRLWEQTCFEFFLKQQTLENTQTDPYWEFNLSPSGQWNVFALSGYRQGLREEASFASLPFEVHPSKHPSDSQTGQALTLTAAVDLSSLISPSQPICLGISAVVVLAGEPAVSELAASESIEPLQETFWALAHPGKSADFHHPGSFTLTL